MPNKHACFFLRINLTINVAHPVYLMHTQSLLSGYAPVADYYTFCFGVIFVGQPLLWKVTVVLNFLHSYTICLTVYKNERFCKPF